MSNPVQTRLEELNIALDGAVAPVANFVPVRRLGNVLFVSGHASRTVRGKVGADVSASQAYDGAREVAIQILRSLAAAGEQLERLRVVKVLGFVNSAPDFTNQPSVINGASDIFVDVFGRENGSHARSAVGVAQLPGNAAVEVEAIFEVL